MIDPATPWHQDSVHPRLPTAPILLLAALTTMTLALACDPPPPESCQALADEPEANAIPTTIEIRNVGDVPLFLPEVGGDRHDLVRFAVDGIERTDNPAFPGLHCALAPNDIEDICAEEPLPKDGGERLLRLDPGATRGIAFDGYVWETVQIDDACFDGPLCPYGSIAHCQAGRVVESGSAVSLRILPATSCSFGGSECTCPQGESACEIAYDPYSSNQPILGDALPEFELQLEYTGQPIVIELGG